MILWKGNCTYWPYGTFYIIHTMIISNNSLSSLLLLHTIGSYIIKNSFINEKTKQKSMCIINWKMFQQLLNTIEHKKENKTKKQIIKTEIFSSYVNSLSNLMFCQFQFEIGSFSTKLQTLSTRPAQVKKVRFSD